MTASNPVKLSAQAIKNILYTPVFQAIEDGCPELGTFVFTNPHSQNIFLAIQIDSNGNVHCFFHNLPFAVDMNPERLRCRWTPTATATTPWQWVGSYRWSDWLCCLRRKCRRCLGYVPQYCQLSSPWHTWTGFSPQCPDWCCLILFHHLRLKFSLPVLRDGYPHISKAGTQRLTTVAVPKAVILSLLEKKTENYIAI